MGAMALIEFTVVQEFDVSAKTLWDEMLDWPAHGDWVPATRVEIESGNPGEIGETFTGYTGYGPLTLVDRMRVTAVDWNDVTNQGSCEVEKLGPLLTGRAGFVVSGDETQSKVEWFEEVTVPYLPQFLAPLVNRVGGFGFSVAMKKLARKL